MNLVRWPTADGRPKTDAKDRPALVDATDPVESHGGDGELHFAMHSTKSSARPAAIA